MKRMALIVFLAVITPLTAFGQSFEWSAHPIVLLDFDHTPALEVGPGVSFSSFLSSDGPISYGLFMALARTDFSVAVNNLHRNFGSVGLGLRWMTGGEKTALGLDVGLGFSAWDDVSETHPGFTSSADGEEMVTLGIQARIQITPAWGISVFIQDQITGWYNALLSTMFNGDDYGVSHRLLAGAGIYIR